MSVRDSETESDITPNIEEGGVAKIEGGTDDQETGADPISDNIRTDPDSENGQMVTNSLQVQQRGIVNQLMDISRLSADSVVVLDESNKVDSALFKALKGMGAQLSGNESEASKCERLSEPSQTLAKVSSGSFTDPQLKPDPVLLVNTPAMIKYRKHKNEEYLKRLRKLHDKSASDCIICEYCGAVLNSKNLANHIAAFHTVDTHERRYQCEVCGNLYLRHENLQRHLSTHSGAKVCCGHCGKSFQHQYSLKAHEKTHWEIPPSLPVRKPKYRTLDPKTRRPRDKRQSETNQQEVDPIVRRSKQVSCQMCGKTVSCKSLCRHLRTVHKVINEASRSRSKKSSEETCITCGKTVSRRYLKRHLRIHSETGPRQENRLVACEICGKVLRKASMRNHLGTHNPKMSKCEICGKVIRNGSKYSHAKLHTDKREHACSYCDFRFHFRSSLVTHLRRHTKERPIPCRYCEQTFSRYETRNIHERLHTGERPYKCEVCHKAWRNRATYSHHMQKYHPKLPMQRKLWPPPIQSDVQQVIKCNPGK
ncbi:Zinc finger protein 57 [Holothuria leucospilota]|uniref:Zinc finger protein 57 n=1 Tax=Holothuria leucospilota TaxID=206669 RepID=A0A9Q1C851_HOLLE|nr:Zinc finger protein 57 [Holothuria leucospilota]